MEIHDDLTAEQWKDQLDEAKKALLSLVNTYVNLFAIGTPKADVFRQVTNTTLENITNEQRMQLAVMMLAAAVTELVDGFSKSEHTEKD